VIKVQQALLDLGFDLGPQGVDGDYGPATANAVKQFKAQHRLGFEQFGDVGPGTMGRLDQLFAPAPIDPPEPKSEATEDDSSCPFDADELFTGVAESSPEVATSEALVATEGKGTGTPATHLTIPQAIQKFQSQVNVVGIATGGATDKNLTDRGQFFWSLHVSEAIDTELTLLASDPTALPFVVKARDARRIIMAGGNAKGTLTELKAIADKSKSPSRAAMQTLVAPDSLGGPGQELRLWKAYIADNTNSLPNLTGSKSLFVLQSMRKAENTACWSHAVLVAQKLKKKGGLKPLNPKVPPVSAQLANDDSVRDRRPKPAGSDTHLGDVFTQSGVGSAVAAMKKALDAGQVIHARVMSGVGFGTTPFVPADGTRGFLGKPPEEHSLLIIGFDDNTFVFHDPDAAVSNTPTPGFGQLVFDGKRLSTATSDADMTVNPKGRHVRGDKRYQIIRLFTI
jgi:peptidoglycan hydrolase-like protein with peptidoglycan-binding domain